MATSHHEAIIAGERAANAANEAIDSQPPQPPTTTVFVPAITVHSPAIATQNHLQINKEHLSPASPGGIGVESRKSAAAHDFKGGQEMWNAMMYELVLYKSRNAGDANVRFDDNNPRDHGVYSWLQLQRKHYRLFSENKPSYITQERASVLETLGVQWNLRGDVFWDRMYETLQNYKMETGDTLVPRKYAKEKKIGEWVTDQRRQYKHKMSGKATLLSDERQRKLDDLGFVWSIRNRTDWNDRYQQLAEFKKESGNCAVPQMYSKNKALGKWVSKQREQYRFYLQDKPSFMSAERIDALNQLGFAWSIKGRKTSEIEELEQAYNMRTQKTVVAVAANTAVNVSLVAPVYPTTLIPIKTDIMNSEMAGIPPLPCVPQPAIGDGGGVANEVIDSTNYPIAGMDSNGAVEM